MDESKSLLVHICCAPCLSGVHGYLKSLDFEAIKGFFYNPNIHPFTEFKRRRHFLRLNEKFFGLDEIEYSNEYPLKDFLKGMASSEDRCTYCYRIRLGETASKAHKNGFSHFTTTLLISPYQKQELLIKTGHEMAEKHGVKFHDEDLRRFFDLSRQIARSRGIYLQGYCGCIFSEYERYDRKKIRISDED